MTPLKTLRRQAGISLLEVLIAMLVLSLGLLGLAGLQMSALRNNQSAMERSMAVVESYSIVDAMRIAPNAVDNGDFDLSLEDSPASGTFAGNQLIEWRGRLQNLLGESARGAVSCADSVCTVTIEWDDQRGTSGSDAHQVITEARL